MLSVSEVWRKLDHLAAPLDAAAVPLADAAGRILRVAATAPEDQPAFDRASIDGYVATLATPAGTALHLTGSIPAGQAAPSAPEAGTTLKIFTGSAVPSGPVGLVMHEDTALDPVSGRVLFRTAPSAALIRRRASQARAGDTLLEAGSRLDPGSLALLASIGQTTPVVTRRVRVAHLVTGGELVPADATPAIGRIRDSNSTLIAALLAAAGADLVAHARAGESFASVSSAFATLLDSAPDLVLVSGGSSGGDHDHTSRVFAAQGFTLTVNQVASRPGKPLLVAHRGPRIAIGLPGNPLSHFVCFHLFVARLLVRLGGGEPAPVLRLPLAPGAPLRPHPRETWWPASRTPAGYAPLPWTDSSDLTVLTRTHALLRVPAASTPASESAPPTTAEGLLV